jgi:hypothetical protein
VGGGGRGVFPGGDGSGGGVAGGVLYLTLSGLDNDTCSFTVGQGGAIPTALGQGNGGTTSSISFAHNTGLNRSATGGGRGASYPSNGVSAAPGSGGCGGGGQSDCTFAGFHANASGTVRMVLVEVVEGWLAAAIVAVGETKSVLASLLNHQCPMERLSTCFCFDLI